MTIEEIENLKMQYLRDDFWDGQTKAKSPEGKLLWQEMERRVEKEKKDN